ncbi:MAG: KH domain-containing protein [Clostridiales bacterium]|nr:KH domain-containing protein [Clostridiales bacterium]
MLKEAIATGATIEEAEAAARLELNAPDDADIKIEVIDLPAKKTLGLFGGSLAKVKASYELEESESEKPAPGKKQKAKKTASAPKKSSKKRPPAKEKKEEDPAPQAEGYEQTREYLTSILTGMGLDSFEIKIEEKDDDIYIELDCDKEHSLLIGRRGETLDAIQYLTRLNVSRNKESYKRVLINVGNYRERREATLRRIAAKNAEKAKRYGRNMYLDPMNPYERRIVHTEVQTIDGVESHSVGSDSNRRVVITPDQVKTDRPVSNHQRSAEKADNNKGKSEEAERKPRSDFSGATLYGKIEPK